MTKKTNPNPNPPAKLTAEEFVRLWQTCETRDEFETQSGLSAAATNSRVAQYRGAGVPLKRMPRTSVRRVDYSALAKLAESLNK
jgi:hypothetical protein